MPALFASLLLGGSLNRQAIAEPAVDGQVKIPPLTARVTDLTGTLAPTEKQALGTKIAAFEKRKGSQIAVLILPTTGPETIEEFSIRVAEQWKIGRAKVDDGVLLIVAKSDRRLRIEVGYGLEGAITDATANRIIDGIIKPRFKRGEFYSGIHTAIDRLIRIIDGQPLPEVGSRTERMIQKEKEEDQFWDEETALTVFIVGIILLGIAAGFLVVILGVIPAQIIVAVVSVFLGLLTLGFAAGIFLALAMVIWAWILENSDSDGSYSGSSSGSSSSGWTSSSSYSSSSSSYSSSSYSGGGGSFGGGGASGSW